MSALNFSGLTGGTKLLDETAKFNDPKLLAPKPENGSNNEYEMYIRFIPNLGSSAKANILEKNMVRLSTGENGESIAFDMPKTSGYTSIFKTFDSLLRKVKYEQKNEALFNLIHKENFSTYSYYYAYVYVENDPTHPENNGHIRILRFPYTIYKLIKEENEGTELHAGCDVFSLISGKRFYYKVRKESGFAKYDKCKFEEVVPFMYNAVMPDGNTQLMKTTQEEIDAIIAGQETPLKSFLEKELNGLERYEYEDPTDDQLKTAGNIMRQFLFKYKGLNDDLFNQSNDAKMKSLVFANAQTQVIEMQQPQSVAYAPQQPQQQAAYAQPQATAYVPPQAAAQPQAGTYVPPSAATAQGFQPMPQQPQQQAAPGMSQAEIEQDQRYKSAIDSL